MSESHDPASDHGHGAGAPKPAATEAPHAGAPDAHTAPAHAEHAPSHEHAPAPAHVHGADAHAHAHGTAHDHGAGHAHGSEHAHAAAGAHGHDPAHEDKAHHAAEKARAAALGKNIGMSMAVMGVLLAFCSALVGGQRTELIASMVQQTNTSGNAESVATKYRVLQAQLQQLHALTPSDQGQFDRDEAELQKLEAATAGDAQWAPVVRVARLEAKKVRNTVTPTQEDLDRFAGLVQKFAAQKEASRQWVESYDGAIEAHALGAERFEWGQLAAEFGIVTASVAMLFQSRKLWFLALLFGLTGLYILVWTLIGVQLRLHAAEKATVEAERRYVALTSEKADEKADEELLEDVCKPR